MGAAIPLVVSVAGQMFAPALSAGIASVMGVAAGTLTNVIAGALIGAATSALMGGNPLTGALFGGLGGGLGSVAGGMFGGGGEAAAGAAEGATVAATGAEGGLAAFGEGLAPAAAVPLEGGGIGPPPTTAYDAVRSSITQGSENILGTGENIFSEGLLPGPDTPLGMNPFDAAPQETPGLLDQIFSQDTMGEMLAGGGRYLQEQGLAEDKAKAQGEQLRETEAFKNTLKHQGIEGGQGIMLTNAMNNVRGTRAEDLGRGYSGRYEGYSSQAAYKPRFQQGTILERT